MAVLAAPSIDIQVLTTGQPQSPSARQVSIVTLELLNMLVRAQRNRRAMRPCRQGMWLIGCVTVIRLVDPDPGACWLCPGYFYHRLPPPLQFYGERAFYADTSGIAHSSDEGSAWLQLMQQAYGELGVQEGEVLVVHIWECTTGICLRSDFWPLKVIEYQPAADSSQDRCQIHSYPGHNDTDTDVSCVSCHYLSCREHGPVR